MDFQRLYQGIQIPAYSGKHKWFIPDVTAIDLHEYTSNGITCEECESNDEGGYSYSSTVNCECVRGISRTHHSYLPNFIDVSRK